MVEIVVEGTPASVHLELSGPEDGPRLLILHGWGASIEQMKPIINPLAHRFRIAALDFPGHGRSPVPAKAYGMNGHLDVIDGILDHLGWTSFGIVGHSNGGRAALTWAAIRPEAPHLEYMALIAPSGIRRKRTSSWFVKTWTARILKAPFQVLPRLIREPGLDWLRHSLVWRLLGSSDYRALEGVMRETFVRTVNHYVTELLPDIRSRVLIIRGEQDSAILDDQVQALVEGIPDAGLFTIQNAGHYAQIDRADVVTAAIEQLAAS